MKNKKKKLLCGFITLGLLTTSIIPLTLISCGGSNQEQTKINYGLQISSLTNNYRNSLNAVVKTLPEFYQYTSNDLDKLLSVCNDYLAKAQGIYNNHNKELNIDETIWIKSLIDEIEVKKQLLESKIHLLIIDKYDRLAFTNYSGVLSNSISTAFRKFNTYLSNAKNKEALNYLQQFIEYLLKVKINLQEGQAQKITMSGVMTKHSIGNLLQSSFNSLLRFFIDNNQKPTFNDLETNNVLPFTSIAKQNNIQDNQFLTVVKAVDRELMNFLDYLTNDYYASIEYGRSDPLNTPYQLIITSDNPNEEDNGFNYKNKYIQGLGLSAADLNTKDIGVGFTPNVEYAKKIYNALIKKHSNTNNTAAQIFNIGNNAVKEIKNNMKEVAKIVGEVFVGKNATWSATNEFYDRDSSGNEYGSTSANTLLDNIISPTGEVDLEKFFIWMNTDRWFNGRDMRQDQFPTIDGVKPIYSKYYNSGTNPISNWDGRSNPYKYESTFNSNVEGITSVNISDIIGDYQDYMDTNFVVNKNLDNQISTIVNGDAGNLAYKYLVQGLSPATIQSSNTITNNQQNNSISPEAAFIGTSKAISQYLQFKEATANHISAMFTNTSIDYTLRTGTGGAAYANSGEGSWSYSNKGWGGFYLDTNPYYGLQKWSMSTLSIHEAISGHVFQFNYAHDHPAVDYAPSFSSTAYAEGWGLFSEWLAVQVGVYGEPIVINDAQDNQLALPKFGVNSKTLNVKQFKNRNDYANGAYWVEDDKSTIEHDEGNSQTLYDALQYFGFLNERQLRAMRCAVDVGIHAGGAAINTTGDVVNSTGVGEYKKNTGWSLNDARTYLQKNSGLGLDDIKRETKRYLEYTGQAVSYYNGTVAIQKLFTNAAIKYSNTYHTNFIDWQDTISTRKNSEGLFDIILRNGAIPIDVLIWAGENYILNNFNA